MGCQKVLCQIRDHSLQQMTKELKKMLGIETKLSTTFYSQTDGQMERMNQELEQYLRFFIDHRQKDWPKWLALAEFTVNNKIYSATKVSPFRANYGRKLRIGVYQEERKDGKGDGVCRKDKEGSGRGRSSIKEGVGRKEAEA